MNKTDIFQTVDLASPSEEEICRTIRTVTRQVREARGWTCEFVSEMLDMSISEYRELESGEGILPLITTLRLALALCVPVEALLGIQPVDLAVIAAMEKVIEHIEETARQLRSHSPDEEKAFLDEVEALFDKVSPADDELWSPFLPSSTFA